MLKLLIDVLLLYHFESHTIQWFDLRLMIKVKISIPLSFFQPGIEMIDTFGYSVQFLSAMPSQHLQYKIEYTSSAIPQYFFLLSTPQLIRSSHNRHVKSLQIKRRDNGSGKYCHTSNPMRTCSEAEHVGCLQPCPTQRHWPCRIVGQQCLPL